MPSQTNGNNTNGGRKARQGNHSDLKNGSTRASVSTTVTKAITILDILAQNADDGINLTELCALIDIPKSTTYRYLVTLQELGLTERKSNDRYYLGTRIIELAGAYLLKSDLRNESQAALDELAEITAETVHLAVPSGTEVIYIAKIESKHTLGMFSHIGARLPMHCTALGKAILAFSDKNTLQLVINKAMISRTPHSIVSTQALENELAMIRSQGYAIDNEENELGIRCVGAPIFDYTGKPVGAISVSAPCDRMDKERSNFLGPLVRQATQMVSRRKGFSGMNDYSEKPGT
jgi:IclR family acetate operon transcriptional repressor